MATSKSLKTAVKTETDKAEKSASTGNVKTTKAPPDLPTGTRRGQPSE
jgi:hypothetical protein